MNYPVRFENQFDLEIEAKNTLDTGKKLKFLCRCKL